MLNFSRPGELLAALAALEAIARLAACLPESLQTDIPEGGIQRLDTLGVIHACILAGLVEVPKEDNASLLNQEALGRIPALVESCVKLALVAMRPPGSQGSAASPAYLAARLDFSNSMLLAAGLLFEQVALLLTVEPRTALAPEAMK